MHSRLVNGPPERRGKEGAERREKLWTHPDELF